MGKMSLEERVARLEKLMGINEFAEVATVSTRKAALNKQQAAIVDLIGCPKCGAEVGRLCKRAGKSFGSSHMVRLELAHARDDWGDALKGVKPGDRHV
jgi:hypothetical protein